CEQQRDDLAGRHAARVAPVRRGPTATPPIAAGTPGRNHQPRKKPRRSDPASSPPLLSDGRLPQKAFLSQSLNRAKPPYPGYLLSTALLPPDKPQDDQEASDG